MAEHGSIAERVGPVRVALLFAGAARTALFDGANLTLTSAQAAEAAAILDVHHVVPLHFEGWARFSEGRERLVEASTRRGWRIGCACSTHAPRGAVPKSETR